MLFDVAFNALGIVFLAESFGVLVSVTLEVEDLAGEAAKDEDGAREFFGVSCKLLAGLGFEEEAGKFGSG